MRSCEGKKTGNTHGRQEGSAENGSRKEKAVWRKKGKGMIQQANDEVRQGPGTTQPFRTSVKATTQQEARADRDPSHKSPCTAAPRSPQRQVQNGRE